MDEKGIKRGLKIFGTVFIILSIIELVSVVILWNATLNLEGRKILFQDLILTSNIMPSFAKYIFFFLVVSILFFLIIGVLHWKISSKINFDDKTKAKQLLFLGVLILIFSFIKIGYITFLGRIRLNLKNPRTLLSAFYNINISPFYVNVIWIFFITVVCCYLIIGLFEGGGGLKWTLIIQEKEIEEENKT